MSPAGREGAVAALATEQLNPVTGDILAVHHVGHPGTSISCFVPSSTAEPAASSSAEAASRAPALVLDRTIPLDRTSPRRWPEGRFRLSRASAGTDLLTWYFRYTEDPGGPGQEVHRGG
jgi:hypothetical protein